MIFIRFSLYVKLFPNHTFGAKLQAYRKALCWCLHGIRMACLFTYNSILLWRYITMCNAARLIELKLFIMTHQTLSWHSKPYVVFLSSEYDNREMFSQRFHWFKGQKTLNFNNLWSKYVMRQNVLFFTMTLNHVLFFFTMPRLFTRGKFPAVNLTSVFPNGKIFFTAGDVRPSPMAKRRFALMARGVNTSR